MRFIMLNQKALKTSLHFLFILSLVICFNISGVQANLQFEEIYDGTAEWTSEKMHNGESVAKLLIPEGANVRSGAIVRTSLNIPLNTLESFSNYISHFSARPRFLIYLDTTGNDEVDFVLMSDYQDFGDGEWTLATGGLRWGWTSVDYPLTGSYGDPWNPLIYWKNTFASAQVLSLGVYLEYWGTHPEGIGEPLYVSNFNVTRTDSGSSSNTYLSLEPSLIESPFLDGESANTFVEVTLKVYDVSDLKQHHVEFNYDGEILDYFGGEMVFRLLVGGSTGSPLGAIYPKTFTGTTTMYRYVFKVLKPGFTSIDLINTQLKDDLGIEIPHSVSGCSVHIMEYGEWADQQYSDLETSYNLLQSSYADLLSDYQYLDSTYTSLQSNYTDLQLSHNELEAHASEQYMILEASYNELNLNFENLATTHSELLEEHQELEESLVQLQSEFDFLSNDYIEKNQANLEIERELENTRSLFLLSTTLAVFFFIIILSKRRPIFT